MTPGPHASHHEAEEPDEHDDVMFEATTPSSLSDGPPRQSPPRGPRSLTVLGEPWADGRHTADHRTLRSLLGAWALHACSPEEAEALEHHLVGCQSCADEADRLRDSVRWLSQPDPLDLDPLLRARVLDGCLGRHPARVPVPRWATAYNTETARLDALLGSLVADEWDTVVELVWRSGSRRMTVCEVLTHLGCVDGLLASKLGLGDPLGEDAPRGLDERTSLAVERCWAHSPQFVRSKWRIQTQAIVRTAAFAGEGIADLPVDYGGRFALPTQDAFVERAFACWVHADDIARAVDYPYKAPAPDDLRAIVDLITRMLPLAIAERRRLGLTSFTGRLVEAGTAGRSVRLQVEGPGGGDWHVPLDSPASLASPSDSVAHLALEGVELCQLAAGHRDPSQVAVGMEGDHAVVRDVLRATASLSRL